jgi:hypothetical protein
MERRKSIKIFAGNILFAPLVWLRKGEKQFLSRLKAAFEDSNALNAHQYL